MLKNKNDCSKIFKYEEEQFEKIEKKYKESLDKQKIDTVLPIEIKNFFENHRSCLDYLAHDIANILNIKTKTNKFYFPIVSKDSNTTAFEDYIRRSLPGLKGKNLELYQYIESIQPYHVNNSWLGDFMTIVNENKHVKLTPQIRTETKELSIEGNGNVMRIRGKESFVKIGKNCKVGLGNTTLPGGQEISPESKQIFYEGSRPYTKTHVWVDFKFNGTISALDLISKVYINIPLIVEEVYKKLQNAN